jgi:putative glutamine amidotransferase
MKADLPVLGICRGCQLLAVAAGGSLYQDIKLFAQSGAHTLRHYQYLQRDLPSHGVTVSPGSLLHSIVGEEIMVNSLHHQAVKDAPQGWLVSARAKDGVIEGLECPDSPFVLGVQWHPEQMTKRAGAHLSIFSALVEAAAAAKRPGNTGG